MKTFTNKLEAEQYARNHSELIVQGFDGSYVSTKGKFSFFSPDRPVFAEPPPDGPRSDFEVRVLTELKQREASSTVCYADIARIFNTKTIVVADIARRYPEWWML